MRKIIYWGLLAGIILILVFWFLGGQITPENNKENVVGAPNQLEEITPIENSDFASNSRPASNTTNRLPTSNFTEEKNKIPVKITAGDKSYDFSISQGKNIYEAMQLLSSTANFSFTAKYYSSLGFLIESINGIKNENGTYWTLYVNGKYSDVGASSYYLKENDTVEWKFERR